MAETKCPNVHSPEYMELEKELGEVKAFAAWVLNNDEIPSIERARKLLSSDLVLAPNGKESKLYSNLLKEVGNNKERALQLHQQTKSPAFKKWFGDSKVVDENGEPLIVYHGGAGQFDKFNKPLTNELESRGIFFTDNIDYAKQYSHSSTEYQSEIYYQQVGELSEENKKELGIPEAPKEIIYPVFLSIKDPLINPEKKIEKGHTWLDRLIASKDGVIGKDVEREHVSGKVYVVFEPNQIKSVFNKGEYSQQSDNIYFQLPDNTKTIKNELQDELQGRGKERQGDNIQTVLSFFRPNEGTGKEGKEKVQAQSGSIINFITANDLWYKGEMPNADDKIGNGSENTVYRISKGNVIKFNNGEGLGDWKKYLENLVIHNYFFSDVPYKLLGFLKPEGAEDIKAVVEQPFIVDENTIPATTEQINNWMSTNGFFPVSNNPKNHDYYNKDLGIHIDDMHDENVLSRDSKLFFIDTRCWADGNLWKNDSGLYNQLSTTNKRPADIDLNKQLIAFTNSLGGSVNYKPEIIVNGKPVDANEVTDIYKRTIEIADGKEDITTLPEAASHIYFSLLPKDSPLRADLLEGVEDTSFYDKTYDQYKNDPYYQDANGEPDEEKIAEEAVGKMMADAIINENADRKAKKWWQRLWEWIKGIFKGKTFDNPYKEVASDILDKKLSKLDLDKVKEANQKGEIFFQLSDKDKETIKQWKEEGITPLQSDMIDTFVVNNTMAMIPGHIYVDAKDPTFQFTPISRAIKGDFGDDVFTLNRELGIDFHTIMQDRILGKTSLKDVTETRYLIGEVRGMAWSIANQIYDLLTKEKGTVLLPEIILPDKDHGVAGTTDLISVKQSGLFKIIDFKTSKERVLDSGGNPTKKYMEQFYTKKNGSIVDADLTSNLQQGIQLNCYNRMVAKIANDIKDFSPFAEDPETHHIFIEFEDDGKTVKNIVYEGFIKHPAGANRKYVDKILGEDTIDWKGTEPEDDGSTAPEGSKIAEESKVDMSNLEPHLRYMSKVLNEQIGKVMDEMGGGSTENQLKYVTDLVDNLNNAGEQGRALNTVLNYIEHASKKYDKFINDPKRLSDPRYYPCLTECVKIVNSDLRILPEHLRGLLDDAHKQKFDRVRDRLNKLNIDANIQSSNYVKTVGGNHNPFVTDEQFQSFIFKSVLDSSSSGVHFSPTGHLADEKLQHLAIVIKDIVMEGNNNGDLKKAELLEVRDRVEKVLGPLTDQSFDKFYIKDAKGKPTHRLVSRIGGQVGKIKDELQSALIDDDENYKEYLSENTPEAKAHNLSIFPAKEALTNFNRAETLGDGGKIVSGTYHHLSDEYQQERDKVMYPSFKHDQDGNPYSYEWKARPGEKWDGNKQLADSYFGEDNWEFIGKTKDIQLKYEKGVFKMGEQLPAEKDPDFLDFRDNYQEWREYWSMVRKQGQPIGIVVKKNGYFPRRENVEVNNFNTSTGEDMRDPQWKEINGIDKPLDDKGRAWLDIYNSYTSYMKEASEKMGSDWNLAMKNGGILAMSNKIFKTASENGTFPFINHNISELWGRVPKGNEKTDILGISKLELRAVPMNNFRNNQKVEDLKGKLKTLIEQKEAGKILNKEYIAKRKELTDALNDEEHKIAPEDMERDLIKAAMVYCSAAEGIKAQRDAEGQIQALINTISGKVLQDPSDPNSNVKYQKTKLNWLTRKGVTDNEGNPVYLQPYDANTVKRLRQLERIFYNVSINHGEFGKLVQKFMNFVSFSVMTNPLTNFKNLALYQVMNARAAIISKYYPAKYYRQASALFFSEYIPGAVKNLLEPKDRYKDKKPQSFMEAFMKHYHIGTKERTGIEGQGRGQWIDKAETFELMNIKLSEFGNIGGFALSEQITNSTTGETVNAFDQSHEWNPQTGHFALKPGFNPEDMKRVILKGRQIQLECQGNFERVDQPLAKETLVGLVLFQFRNFIAGGMNIRYGAPRNDLIFGQQEGSWRTPLALIKLVQEADGDFKERMKEGWNNLRPDQKKNIYQDVVDIFYLMGFIALSALLVGIAKGIDSDDEKQKRWANLIINITNTLRFENQLYIPGINAVALAEFMQNPFALSSTLQSFATAIYLTTEWPFQDDDERNYKNGIFAGTSKAAYQYKKALPILKAYQRYQRAITDTEVGIWK